MILSIVILVNLGIGYKNWDVIDLAWYCTMVCSREFFLKLWTGNGASNTCTGVQKAGLSQILGNRKVCARSFLAVWASKNANLDLSALLIFYLTQKSTFWGKNLIQTYKPEISHHFEIHISSWVIKSLKFYVMAQFMILEFCSQCLSVIIKIF